MIWASSQYAAEFNGSEPLSLLDTLQITIQMKP